MKTPEVRSLRQGSSWWYTYLSDFYREMEAISQELLLFKPLPIHLCPQTLGPPSCQSQPST